MVERWTVKANDAELEKAYVHIMTLQSKAETQATTLKHPFQSGKDTDKSAKGLHKQ